MEAQRAEVTAPAETKEEFTERWIHGSAFYAERVASGHYVAIPCLDCDYERCKGWQMLPRESAEFYLMRDAQ